MGVPGGCGNNVAGRWALKKQGVTAQRPSEERPKRPRTWTRLRTGPGAARCPVCASVIASHGRDGPAEKQLHSGQTVTGSRLLWLRSRLLEALCSASPPPSHWACRTLASPPILLVSPERFAGMSRG